MINPSWMMQVSLACFLKKQDDNLDPKREAFPLEAGGGRCPLHCPSRASSPFSRSRAAGKGFSPGSGGVARG